MLTRVSTGVGDLTSTYDLSRCGLASKDVVFGRNAESDITLNTEALPLLISRKHAVISLVGQNFCIQDQGSTNGTYVDEQKLGPMQLTQLREGSLVSFGGPKRIVRDGHQHSNPFVYKLSAVGPAISHAIPVRTSRRVDNTNVVAVPSNDQASTVVNSGEEAVDLTRTTSLDVGPSDIVDLTNSPDIQGRESRLQHASLAEVPQHANKAGKGNARSSEAGHKRARAIAMAAQAVSVSESAQAAARIPPDNSAKKALENEFECTICRDFMVMTHSVVPCGHMFCGECASQWLQKNPSCPKCRAAATGWVQTIAVDNVLESLVEKTMTPQELQERQQRKKSWETNSVQINNRMKSVFRGGSAIRGSFAYGQRMGGMELFDPNMAREAIAAIANMPGYGGMMWPAHRHHHAAQQMHPAANPGMQAGRGALVPPDFGPPPPRHHVVPAPRPVINYSVAYNVDTHRTLCKTCRNPIASNSLKVGYRDRNQMRWFHLGCLPADRWSQASQPGRLQGLPDLPPAQQGDVRMYLNP